MNNQTCNIKFNAGNYYDKGGAKMQVLPLNELIKDTTVKEEQWWTQAFTTGYRVYSSHVDWDKWNGCTFVDIDTKNFEGITEEKAQMLLDALYEYLCYEYYNNFYAIQISHSKTSIHVYFYYDVEKNETNFKKCAQYSNYAISSAFIALKLEHLLKYVDKCTKSFFQGFYVSRFEIKTNEFISDRFGIFDNINEYEIEEEYKIKVNDVNDDLTTNFNFKSYKEKDVKIKEQHHLDRMAIYLSLVAVFKDETVVNEHWKNICVNHISCPNYTPNKMYNDAIKNRWYDKYASYAYMVNIDLLRKFGYDFERTFIPQELNDYVPDVTIKIDSTQYLSDANITFDKYKINHIFAGCGFGKTYWTKQLGKNNRVCVISPLRSINKDSFENTNFLIIDETHKDETKEIINIHELKYSTWNVCTTWESFILYDMYKWNFDYVIVDEIHTLFMYDYRINSIKNLMRYLPKCNGIKIVMTGTYSLELDTFDCYKIKIEKEQKHINAEILCYNKSFKGWLYKDIKDWTSKNENNYAVIFKDTANYKDEEDMNFEGMDVFMFNSNYNDNVDIMIETKDLPKQIVVISVYGQAGINIIPSKEKCIRIYVLNNNSLAAIQYANRIRVKECVDKVIIPVKKDSITNDVRVINKVIDYDTAKHQVDVINATTRKFDIFETANKQKLKFKHGFSIDCLDKISDEYVLNEDNYKLYTIIQRVNRYERQMQVLYNRLTQNYFDVTFNYLIKDVDKLKRTRFRATQLAGQLTRFDDTQIKQNKRTGKIYMQPNDNFKKVCTGDFIQVIEDLINIIASATPDYINKFKEIIKEIVKDKESIKKSDLSHIKDLLHICKYWDSFYDNAFIYVINNKTWDDNQVTAALVRSMYNDKTKDDWQAIADEMYTKIKYINKSLQYTKYVSDIVDTDMSNPNMLDIENDDITSMIYTYMCNKHTRGGKRENAGRKKK